MTPNPPNHKGRKQVKVNALAFAQLVKYMLEGVHTCEALAELTGLHYVTVLHYARELHAAGAAHIACWEKDSRGRDAIRIYQIGEGKDAKRSAMTDAQRQLRYRSKMKTLDMIQRTAA